MVRKLPCFINYYFTFSDVLEASFHDDEDNDQIESKYIFSAVFWIDRIQIFLVPIRIIRKLSQACEEEEINANLELNDNNGN